MMLSVGGEADPRRPSLISQAYSEPPLTPSAQRARKISVFGEHFLETKFSISIQTFLLNYSENV